MFAKIKLYLIIGTLVAIILLGGGFGIKKYFELRTDRNRVRTNLYNSDFKIDSLQTVSGDYFAKMDGMRIKKGELEKFNSSLVDSIKNLKIKLKNVEAVVQIEYKYVYVNEPSDTIYIKELNDSTFVSTMDNDWINIYQEIGIKYDKFGLYEGSENKTHGFTLSVDSLRLSISDNILIVEEREYKGWWFWKKVSGITINIKSENPYMKLEKTKYFKLIK